MPKPIQISVSTYDTAYEKTEVVALCDDGSIWLIQNQENKGCTGWKRLPDIPSNREPDSFQYADQIPRE